ncbi:MAG: flavin oxidoreductase/NADH oxidase [Defluviitaleaceae bacterium]|nr:flavin oxidoreductase/NADH oxidase [Defluviitaleaceae bacterium]
MNLPLSRNLSVLKQSFTVENHTFANRLVVQPMEGADGTRTGEADTLAIRRYDRFATSGAGLIWFEAVAVQSDGRANAYQLWMHEKNTDHYKWLVERIRETAVKNGNPNPVIIMQATHSGRYSRPDGPPEPMIAVNVPIYEKDNPIPPERIVSDDTLRKIEIRYGEITKMAADCGFDGIDVKACHRYLNGELLGAFTRPGPYGGPELSNRARFYKNITAAARAAAPAGFLVTTRLNIYDGIPYPHGFGVEQDGSIEPNLSEPIALLKELNFSMVNISMGNPYFNPYVNRPTDLEGVERMYRLTKEVRDALPGTAIVASAPTFLRMDSPYLAAGAVEADYADFVGFGRLGFAYPTFARDILNDCFDGKQVCVTCAKCSELMRGHSNAGCVVRDKLYTDLYLKMKAGQQ